MSTTDHEYTLLMLEGCKHQGQRITQGTKTHSDVEKNLKRKIEVHSQWGCAGKCITAKQMKDHRCVGRCEDSGTKS